MSPNVGSVSVFGGARENYRRKYGIKNRDRDMTVAGR